MNLNTYAVYLFVLFSCSGNTILAMEMSCDTLVPHGSSITDMADFLADTEYVFEVIKKGDMSLLELFFERGLNCNLANGKRFNLLQQATCVGNKAIVVLLL